MISIVLARSGRQSQIDPARGPDRHGAPRDSAPARLQRCGCATASRFRRGARKSRSSPTTDSFPASVTVDRARSHRRQVAPTGGTSSRRHPGGYAQMRTALSSRPAVRPGQGDRHGRRTGDRCARSSSRRSTRTSRRRLKELAGARTDARGTYQFAEPAAGNLPGCSARSISTTPSPEAM